MSFTDELLKKALAGRTSTSSDLSYQEESLRGSIKPDRTADPDLNFSGVRGQINDGDHIRDGIRISPTVLKDYTLYAQNSQSSTDLSIRPKRNHRNIEKTNLFGADVIAEGFQSGQIDSNDDFVTNGPEPGARFSESPYASTGTDLWLVILDSTESNDPNLGVHRVSSVSDQTIETGTLTQQTNNPYYSYSVVAPAPVQLLPWKEDGEISTFLTVLPGQWPVIDYPETDNLSYGSADSIETEYGSTVQGSASIRPDERVELQIDGAADGNVNNPIEEGDFLVSSVIGTVFVVKSANDNGNDKFVVLSPMKGAEPKAIERSIFSGEPWAKIFKVSDFTDDPTQSPGTNFEGDEVNCLYNNHDILEAIRIKNLVSPKLTNNLESCTDIFEDGQDDFGHGFSIIPQNSSGASKDFDMENELYDFSDVTIDPDVDEDQEVVIDYEEGIVNLSHPIPDDPSKLESDLNPNSRDNANLYACFTTYSDYESERESQTLNDASSNSERKIYAQYGSLGNHPIQENFNGWLASLSSGRNITPDSGYVYHRHNYPDNTVSKFREQDGDDYPHIGFHYENNSEVESNENIGRKKATSLRFQYLDRDHTQSVYNLFGLRAGQTDGGVTDRYAGFGSSGDSDVLFNQMTFNLDPDFQKTKDSQEDFRVMSFPAVASDPNLDGQIELPEPIPGKIYDFNGQINGEKFTTTFEAGTYNIEDLVNGTQNFQGIREQIEGSTSLDSGIDFEVFATSGEDTYNKYPGVATQFVIKATYDIEIFQEPDEFDTSRGYHTVELGFGQEEDLDDLIQWKKSNRLLDWTGDDIKANDIGVAGAGSVINSSFSATYESGFELEYFIVDGGDNVLTVDDGKVQVKPIGPERKTSLRIQSGGGKLTETLPANYIIFVGPEQNSPYEYKPFVIHEQDTVLLSSLPVPERAVPLWRVRATEDAIVRKEDLRGDKENLQYRLPIVCGDKNPRVDLTLNEAISLAEFYYGAYENDPGSLTIELMDDATLDAKGSGEIRVPRNITIEGDNNTVFVENYTDDSSNGLLKIGENSEIKNLTFDTTETWEAETTATNGNGSTYYKPFESDLFIAEGSYSKFENIDIIGDSDAWYAEVALQDGTGDTGEYSISITAGGSSNQFTEDDTNASSDDTTAIASDLADKIDNTNQLGTAEIRAKNIGDINNDGSNVIAIECENRESLSVDSVGTNDGDGLIGEITLNERENRNTISLYREGGDRDGGSVSNLTVTGFTSEHLSRFSSEGDRFQGEIRDSLLKGSEIIGASASLSNFNRTVIKGCTLLGTPVEDYSVEIDGAIKVENCFPIQGTIELASGGDYIIETCEINVEENKSGIRFSDGGEQTLTVENCKFSTGIVDAGPMIDLGLVTTTVGDSGNSDIFIKGCEFLTTEPQVPPAILIAEDAKTIKIRNNHFDGFKMDTAREESYTIEVENVGTARGFAAHNTFTIPSGLSDEAASGTTYSLIRGDLEDGSGSSLVRLNVQLPIG